MFYNNDDKNTNYILTIKYIRAKAIDINTNRTLSFLFI